MTWWEWEQEKDEKDALALGWVPWAYECTQDEMHNSNFCSCLSTAEVPGLLGDLMTSFHSVDLCYFIFLRSCWSKRAGRNHKKKKRNNAKC